MNFSEWYNTVRNGGVWDYKQRGSEYENFGNFNYGATGRAVGVPAWILKCGAGWAQKRAGTSKQDWRGHWGLLPMEMIQLIKNTSKEGSITMTVLIIVFVIVIIILSGCVPLCDNEVQSEMMSPDLTRQAVTFIRNCGATVDYTQQLSILGAKRSLPNRSGNILILSGKSHIVVEWIDNRTLVVHYSSDHKHKQLKRIRGVSILYENQ